MLGANEGRPLGSEDLLGANEGRSLGSEDLLGRNEGELLGYKNSDGLSDGWAGGLLEGWKSANGDELNRSASAESVTFSSFNVCGCPTKKLVFSMLRSFLPGLPGDDVTFSIL